MNATAIAFAMIFIVIPFGIFFVLSCMILFHIKKYSLQNDSVSATAKLLFPLIMIGISIIIMHKFFLIDWNKIDFAGFAQQSLSNFFPENYE